MSEMDNERWCGCKIPKDYPQIDIHTSKCLRKAYLSNKSQLREDVAVGISGHIPKDESQVIASDARNCQPQTHQSFFRDDGSLIKNHRGTKKAWRAFDNRRRRNAGELK